MEDKYNWTNEDWKNFILSKVNWYGQFSLEFKIGDKILFIDPYNLPDDFSGKADWIFISHDHFDHLSEADLKKVANENTPIFVAKKALPKVKELGYVNLTGTEPGMEFQLEGVSVKTVPMYNEKKDFHKLEDKWNGFLLTIDDKIIYVTCDTERTAAMKEIKADIIMLPLGQVYTMDSIEEAIGAVLDTQAKFAIPVHFGMYEGTKADAEKFCSELEEKHKIGCTILPYLGKEQLK